MTSWRAIDDQMGCYRACLIEKVKLSNENHITKLATTISSEVRFLTSSKKKAFRDLDLLSTEDRIEEFISFQLYSDILNRNPDARPAFVRARVVYQNYLCFVYASESLFKLLNRFSEPGSASKKCSKFLIRRDLHYFRNAIAHANWRYANDFSGIEFWSRKSGTSDQMHKFFVCQDELGFWQALSRCTAYATLLNV